jgi:DNA-binding LacI/PurR family transcriptional regulator
MNIQEQRSSRKRKPVTLKTIAERVGLAPCSISAVLNNTPAARGIPQQTKDRVLRAASQLKYQPNFAARSLRTRRTHSVAVLAQDLGDTRVAAALAGIERGARKRGYLLTVAAWDGDPESLSDHLLQLRQRGVEGLVLIDTAIDANLSIPAVIMETDETPRLEGGIADGRHTRAQGEIAAHTLLDQIEAFARVQSNYEPLFWHKGLQNRPAPIA